LAQIFVLGLLVVGIVFLRKGIKEMNAKEFRRGFKQVGIGIGCLAVMVCTVGILAQVQERQEKDKAEAPQEQTDKTPEEKNAADGNEKTTQVNIKVDRSKQSKDDDDNAVTRAVEPTIMENLKTLNPDVVREVILNVNLARKTPSADDTRVDIDVLFTKGAENKQKEMTFVEIAKQLSKVKDLNKFTIWSYELKMYNPNETNQYMIVVYTKYLPPADELTFDKLVDSSNNGSIDGEMYFNQNRD
jgi:hypothetical protein